MMKVAKIPGMFFALILSLILIFSLPLTAGGSNKSNNMNVYNIQMFGNDIVLNAPVNELYYWFEIKPGIKPGRVLLELWYSCSETIRSENSSITVSLNGRPLSSRRLFKEKNDPVNWQVILPTELLKEGQNEIKISTTQRSTEETCQDIDNKANWVTILANSVIHLEDEGHEVHLSVYPFPFMNYMASVPVQSTWYLKPGFTAEHVELLLQVAADWGKRLRGGNLERFKVSTGLPVEGENQLLLGGNELLPAEQDRQVNAGSGFIFLRPNGSNYYKLIIAAANVDGLRKAVRALLSENINLIEGDELIVQAEQTVKGQANGLKETRNLTLEDLGYGEIKLSGAFHQRTMITVRRPPGWAVGTGSYVQLYFRHSYLLNPERSAVTVYINGRPLKSLALNAGNAEKGELKVYLPHDELDKTQWHIEFAFYHDIGAVDCSKKYEEVAWSVIEKETYVYLAPGKSFYTARWADFPYFDLHKGDMKEKIAMWLPEYPSDSELTLAVLLAARIGQVYGSEIEWKVYLGKQQFPVNEQNVVVICRSNELVNIAENLSELRVKVDSKGAFVVDPAYNISADFLQGKAICQVVGRKDGSLAYVITVPDEEFIDRLITILANPEKMALLQGELCLINREGRVVNIHAAGETANYRGFKWPFTLPFISGSRTALYYLGIVMLVIIGTGITLWLVKRQLR